MAVDNFEQIRSLLKFDNDNDWFYHIQIIQRKKDGGCTINKNCKLIHSYYIRSLKYYDEHIEQIKNMCRLFHARAYIRLNPSSWKKCCLKALGALAEYINSNQCDSLRKLTDEMAGKYNASNSNNEYQKTWIVDYDSKDLHGIKPIMDVIDMSCFPIDGKTKYIATIPTKNGYHIITRPFNMNDFRKYYKEGEIDVHKNNPTLLYYEDQN